jgi:hypothetical protein
MGQMGAFGSGESYKRIDQIKTGVSSSDESLCTTRKRHIGQDR